MGTRRSKHNKGRKPLSPRDLYALDARTLDKAGKPEEPKAAHSGHQRHIPTLKDIIASDPIQTVSKRTSPRWSGRMPTAKTVGEIPKKRSSRAPTLDELKEFIVRPGIEKHLVPLLLYRGNQSLGRVQQLWNHALLMMKAEAGSISEGIKLSHNPEYAQLCGPHRPLPHLSAYTFFSRMRWNPKVTDNIPGLTEYVEWITPRPLRLESVSLETYDRKARAPWRTILTRPKQKRGRKPIERKPREPRPSYVSPRQLIYPYLIHEPGVEHELLLLVNNAVPREVPEQFRADICQDLIVALLSNELELDELSKKASVYIKRVFRMFPDKYTHLSLDAPAPWCADGRTLAEEIDSETEHW